MKYTPELTKKLIEKYQAGVEVPVLAEEFGTNERSVRAKLAAEGVYVKKAYLNKNGEPPIKKEEYVDKIAQLLDVNVEQLESLEKVNKRILKLLEFQLSEAKLLKAKIAEIEAATN